jgi:hypothetical protein
MSVRLTPADHTAFSRKAQKFGLPSDVLRELIQAFIQERLIIKPPVTSKKEGLYHE